MSEHDVLFDKKRWTEILSEFEIVDVAIQERNKIQLCARKRMTYEEASELLGPDIPTRLITLFTDRPAGDNCGFTNLSGMGYPVVGVSRSPFPRPSGLVAAFNRDGDVWPRGGGSGPMEYIAPGTWPGTQRLKCINGYTYSVGAARTIYKRVEVGKWVLLNEGFPEVAPLRRQ